MAAGGTGNRSPVAFFVVAMSNTTIRTSEKADAIIAALKETGSFRRACTKVRISRSALHEWKTDDPAFNEAVIAAKKIGMDYRRDQIEDQFLDVAMDPKHPSYVTAAIFALKNLAPDQYRDRQSLEHTGKDGESLTILLTPRQDGPQ